MNFKLFQEAVSAQWATMQQHSMYRVAVEKDDLWNTYQAAFPEGTNPIFRERREHECNCCKQFIRAVGDCVAVINGKLTSVWDAKVSDPTYQIVALAMAKLVKGKAIVNPFLHYEPKAGTSRTFDEHMTGKAWDHFAVNIKPQFVADKVAIPTKLNAERTARELFARGCATISDQAIEEVLDLIAQGSLYRGDEPRANVIEFRKLRDEWVKLDGPARLLYEWSASKARGSVSGIRNTVIGTLLVALSEGEELEGAVKAFEAKVAPANYKRPSALVTPVMVAKAKAKIAELGLTSALERRYAIADDLTIENVLFVDRSLKIAGDVFDEITARVPVKLMSLDKVEDVSIAKFLADILPRAASIEVLFENRHAGNLVSLIAPVDATAGRLFKWGNNFSWSYHGEMADSIKERVKKAGGNVEGDLCCRLAWNNEDDLDFHMYEPDGYRIYFPVRRASSPSGGTLDVDANGADGLRQDPVENIFYAKRVTMKDGIYKLIVNQYSKRSSNNIGFEVEIDYMGQVRSFGYDKSMRSGDSVTIAQFRHSSDKGMEIIESLPQSVSSKTIWGLPTQVFHRVDMAMLSPNYWDGQGVGNQHHFFMLHGCANDGTARGFYNEFLDSRLDTERKTLEMVGSKLKPAPAKTQLSGLGFSSTQRATLTCRVKGSFNRVINITF